jgi:isopentenyl phosphate kinase
MSLVFVKLGGSLLTDKTQPESLREGVLRRLAGELAAIARQAPGGLVLGHGSGSFGHVIAERWKVHEGVAATPDGADALEGIARTQHLAARLHRRVVAELLAAGARPFSFVPSTAALGAGGRIDTMEIASLVGALDLGLLPVTYGDVLIDRERGSAIASTEAVFEALVDELARQGRKVERCLWLGETNGVLDADGRRIPRLTAAKAHEVMGTVGGSAGTDVTGGMRLRLETALRLAERGVPSRILDGREPGMLERALGEGADERGTSVSPAGRSTHAP